MSTDNGMIEKGVGFKVTIAERSYVDLCGRRIFIYGIVRNLNCLLLVLLLTIMVFVPPAMAGRLSFESFPANCKGGMIARGIDWSSAPESKQFKSALSAAFAKGARFAGHYAVATWGCGSDCQMLAIIDMQTGRVTFGPSAELDFDFQLRSRLLVANSPPTVQKVIRDSGGCPDKENYWAVTSHYYEWTGAQFRHIADVNACEGASHRAAGDRNK